MSLSEQTLSALQTLMAQDKALQTQVQTTRSAAQAADIIAQAAAQNGIEINPAELTQHFEEAAKTSANQALSDSQLEAVAGGGIREGDMIAISIFTFGVGCAVISIRQAITGRLGFGEQKFC